MDGFRVRGFQHVLSKRLFRNFMEDHKLIRETLSENLDIYYHKIAIWIFWVWSHSYAAPLLFAVLALVVLNWLLLWLCATPTQKSAAIGNATRNPASLQMNDIKPPTQPVKLLHVSPGFVIIRPFIQCPLELSHQLVNSRESKLDVCSAEELCAHPCWSFEAQLDQVVFHRRLYLRLVGIPKFQQPLPCLYCSSCSDPAAPNEAGGHGDSVSSPPKQLLNLYISSCGAIFSRPVFEKSFESCHDLVDAICSGFGTGCAERWPAYRFWDGNGVSEEGVLLSDYSFWWIRFSKPSKDTEEGAEED